MAELSDFPDFDPQTVALMGGHRIGILDPAPNSLLAGEIYVQVMLDGTARIWVGAPRPVGIPGNVILVASSADVTQPPTEPGAPVITINSIASPQTTDNPVIVSGTITPGQAVDLGIAQEGVVNWGVAGFDASGGAFAANFSLPVGVDYCAVAYPSGEFHQHVDSNLFDVIDPAARETEKPKDRHK